MLINNSMLATMDIKTVEYNIANNPNCKVIFVGDTMGYENIINSYRLLVASPLVPDYSVMEADIEGTAMEFKFKYISLLETEAAAQYFMTIIAALNRGKFIILFFPPESNGLKYPTELIRFFAERYGIVAAFPEMGLQFSYDIRYDDFNAGLLYSCDLISVQEYLVYAHVNTLNVRKIIFDLRLPVKPNTSIDTVIKWISDYRDRIIRANKPLIRPFNLEVHDDNTN